MFVSEREKFVRLLRKAREELEECKKERDDFARALKLAQDSNSELLADAKRALDLEMELARKNQELAKLRAIVSGKRGVFYNG